MPPISKSAWSHHQSAVGKLQSYMLQIDDTATRNAISHAIDTLQAPAKRHQQKIDILQRYLLQINDETTRRGISGVIANPPPFTTDDGNGTDDAAATTPPSPPPGAAQAALPATVPTLAAVPVPTPMPDAVTTPPSPPAAAPAVTPPAMDEMSLSNMKAKLIELRVQSKVANDSLEEVRRIIIASLSKHGDANLKNTPTTEIAGRLSKYIEEIEKRSKSTDEMKKRLEKMGRQKTELQQKLAKSQKEKECVQKQTAPLQQAMNDLNATLLQNSAMTDAATVATAVKQLRDRLNDVKEKLGISNVDDAKVVEEVGKLKEEIDDAREQLEKQALSQQAKDEALTGCMENLTASEKQIAGLQELEKEERELKNQNATSEQELAACKKELETSKKEKEGVETQKVQLQQQVDTLKNQNATSEQELVTCTTKLEKFEEQKEYVEKQHSQLQQAMDDLNGKLQNSAEMATAVKELRDRLNAAKEKLGDTDMDDTKVAEGVHKLKEAIDDLKNQLENQALSQQALVDCLKQVEVSENEKKSVEALLATANAQIATVEARHNAYVLDLTPLIDDIQRIGVGGKHKKNAELLKHLKESIKDTVNWATVGKYDWNNVHTLQDVIEAAVGVVPCKPGFVPVYMAADDKGTSLEVIKSTRPVTSSWMTMFSREPPHKRQRINADDVY